MPMGDKIPTDIQDWVQNEKTRALFKQREGGNILSKLLEVGVANRQVSPIQAAGLTYARAFFRGRGLAWKWGLTICDHVEDLQLTVGWPENSRLQFLRALQWWEQGEHEKARGLFSMIQGGK